MSNPYETETSLQEYLLFHYGTKEDVLPYDFGPATALEFPIRTVALVDRDRLGPTARALDLGCSVGRSAFELAKFSHSVVGIDYSASFIRAATTLKDHGELSFVACDEGARMRPVVARVPSDVERA
ncbi:MAG: methyltransferase domain-containing protein, partial [Bdellovibrionales bacterium]|nr:methyltransferase domain-containing protein [Bdellovibrionales bacterium]